MPWKTPGHGLVLENGGVGGGVDARYAAAGDGEFLAAVAACPGDEVACGFAHARAGGWSRNRAVTMRRDGRSCSLICAATCWHDSCPPESTTTAKNTSTPNNENPAEKPRRALLPLNPA